MAERYINVNELAYRLDTTTHSIGQWYKFRRENPDNEYAKMLPDFVRNGGKNTRYWKESDVEMIRKFKESIPQGRYGIMGSVTQKYAKKYSELTDAQKACRRTSKKSDGYIEKKRAIMEINSVDADTADYVVKLLRSELNWKNGSAV